MAPMDYVDILKRRKWSLILPALIIFLISAAVALALPSIYMSTSTIWLQSIILNPYTKPESDK